MRAELHQALTAVNDIALLRYEETADHRIVTDGLRTVLSE
jgi:hypothetical protein